MQFLIRIPNGKLIVNNEFNEAQSPSSSSEHNFRSPFDTSLLHTLQYNSKWNNETAASITG